MSGGNAQKYRNLAVIRGGQGLPVRGRRRGMRVRTAAEMVLERDIRDAFTRLAGADGNVPSEAIQKIREGEQRPVGCLGRRVVEAHAAGCEHSRVREIGLALVRWIDRLYEQADETVTEHVYYQGPRLKIAARAS